MPRVGLVRSVTRSSRRASASDPYEAIEALLPRERFSASVDEAAKLAKPDDFDYLGPFEFRAGLPSSSSSCSATVS